MNLHTCPHCQTPALYSHALKTEVSCHSCGVPFTLSRFTQTERTRTTAIVEATRLKARSIRSSRRLVRTASLALLLLLGWFGASVLGIIPDEWRLVNRRFASVGVPDTLSQAVGLVAIGDRGPDGHIEFSRFYTAAAISHDGFMLTSGGVVRSGTTGGMWVFVGGKRLDASPVGADSIADVGLIRVNENLQAAFRLADGTEVPRLNVDVSSAGFPGRDGESMSPLRDTCSVSRGTISHVSHDDTGTEWIDHGAVIDTGGIGGPLLRGGTIVGVNVGTEGLIMKAVSIAPLRSRLLRMMEESRGDSS